MNPFITSRGLKQEDRLALTLFSLPLQYVMRQIVIAREQSVYQETNPAGSYADDINVMSRFVTETRQIAIPLKCHSKGMGLGTNTA